MTHHTAPDVTALHEVISWKRNAMENVKAEIASVSEKMSLLHCKDQDIAEPGALSQSLSLQTEFRRLKVTLDAYLEQELTLENSIAMHTALLPSPAQLLPVEILSYIFVLCMEDAPFINWMGFSFLPFVFGGVCSFWRAVTLSTPLLWSSASLHILSDRKWLNMVYLLLARSGNAPLSLELIWHPIKGDPYIKRVHALLDELLPPLSSRWRRLQLFVPDNVLQMVFNHPLPALEYLALGSDLGSPISTLSRPGQLPKLRTLSFLTTRLKPMQWGIPWLQLTEFNSKSPLSGSEVLRIFVQCPRLERCQLRVGRYHPHTADPDPEGLVVMPRLQSIIFVISNNEDCLGLFHRVVLPSLTNVEFRSAVMRGDVVDHLFQQNIWLKQYLVPLIDRSGCALQCLVLVGISVHEIELRDTVRCIPSLISLEASVTQDGDIVPPDLKDILSRRRLGDLR